VSLLLANVKMTIRSQPVGLPPQESLAGFDARHSAYVDRSSARFRQEVLETKERKSRRLDLRSTCPTQKVAVKEQHRRLLWRDVQLESRQSFFYFPSKPLRVLPILERRYEVIPDELCPFSASLPEAPFKPQVQDVVQVHVCQHG
jgi:hypothetical protein